MLGNKRKITLIYYAHLGQSIAISKNGKVKILSPEEILIRQQNSQIERR
jgi:hypothetical protein